MKTKPTTALAAALLLALGACAGTAPVTTATPPVSNPAAQNGAATAGAAAGKVTAEVASAISGQCAALQPVFQAGLQAGAGADPTSAKGELGTTASFGSSFCGTLQQTGALPATADNNTPKWLSDVEAAERVLAPIAQVALPLALAAI